MNIKIKDQILSAVVDAKWNLLPELVLHCHGKRRGKARSELEEALGEISHANQNVLWGGVVNLFLQNYIKKYLEKTESSQQESCPNNEDEQMDFDILKSFLVLAEIQINVLIAEKKEALEPPEKLAHFVGLIGGLLNEFADLIHEAALSVCEAWVLNGLEKAEDIRPQTVIALLRISVQPDGKKSDVKRLWNLCKTSPKLLSQMTSDDVESAKSTKELIIASSTSSVFLSCEEGVKFLSAVFSVQHLVAPLHEKVKNSLPATSKFNSEKYADVYFRAWKNNQGDMKRKLELDCLQDLMYLAVHANPNANRLSGNLNSLLQHIHIHKKHQQTASMLYSLYEPFLWQSLKVANGHVRSNAANLLCDLFPCTDLTLTHEEKDELMEKQYQAFLSLLVDPCHFVRITTIKGVFSILGNYWLLVPARIIQKMFQIFLTKLIVDASSAEIRKLVVQGMTQLLDCPDAGPFMTDVLPHVAGSFDDVNPSVRIAFMKLLLRVKATRFIKYWKLIPMEHLLNRLAYDTIAVRCLITNLIYSSFLSAHLEEQEMLNRCISLLEMNRDGARRFYQEASKTLDIESLTKFMIFIWRVLQSYVQTTVNKLNNANNSPSQATEEDSPRAQQSSQGRSTKKSKKAAGKQTRNKENQAPHMGASLDDSSKSSNGSKDDNEEPSEIALDNPSIVGGLLDILVIMWTINAPRLGLAQNVKYIDALRTRISRSFPSVWSFFKENDEIGKTLLFLSSFLPKSYVPTMVGLCLSRLKSIEEKEELDERFLTYINALCNWNRLDDIVELISEWLDDAYTSVDGPHNPNKSVKNKKKARVRFEKIVPKPRSALRILRHILEHPLNKLCLLKTNRKLLVQLCTQMGRVKKFLELRLRTQEIPLSNVCSDSFLLDCWYDYLVVVLLLHQDPAELENSNAGQVNGANTRGNESDVNATDDGDQIEAHDSLMLFREFFSSINKPLLEDKDAAPLDWSFYYSCASHLLKAGSDAIAIGIVDGAFAEQFLNFIQKLLKKAPIDEVMWCTTLQGISRIHSHYKVYPQEKTNNGSDLSVVTSQTFSNLLAIIKDKRNDLLNSFDHSMCEKLSDSIGSTLLNFVTDEDLASATIFKQVVMQTLESIEQDLQLDPELSSKINRIKDFNGETSVYISSVHKNTKLSQTFIQELKNVIGIEVKTSSMLEACAILLSILFNDCGRISKHDLKEAAQITVEFLETLEDETVGKNGNLNRKHIEMLKTFIAN